MKLFLLVAKSNVAVIVYQQLTGFISNCIAMKSNIALLWNYILPKQCLTRASYACDSYKYTMNTIVQNPQKTYADQGWGAVSDLT